MKKQRLLLLSSFLLLGLFTTSCVGASGAQGSVGPQGIQGIQGLPGINGFQGAKGDSGDVGATGATGPQGPRGFSGSSGAQGTPGVAGASSSSSVVVPKLLGPQTDAQRISYINSFNVIDLESMLLDNDVAFNEENYYVINSLSSYIKFATYNNHNLIMDELEPVDVELNNDSLPWNDQFFSGKFILGTNIDFNDISLADYSLTNSYELMIGYQAYNIALEFVVPFDSPYQFNGFTGLFDGANHTISNFTINITSSDVIDSIGLFYTSENFTNSNSSGTIFRNLVLDNFNLQYDIDDEIDLAITMGALVGGVGAIKVTFENIIVSNSNLSGVSPSLNNEVYYGIGSLAGEVFGDSVILNNVRIDNVNISETGNANLGGIIGSVGSASFSILNSSSNAYITSSFAFPVDLVITLSNDTFEAILINANLAAWITNLPAGLTAQAKAAVSVGADTVTIVIDGTPTEALPAAITIVIPAIVLQISTLDLTVTTNAANGGEIVANVAITPLVNGNRIYTPNSVGGLVGLVNGSKLIIKHSNNSGNIDAIYSVGVGGIFGATLFGHQMEFDNVYNSGQVKGNIDVGGLVGLLNPVNITYINYFLSGQPIDSISVFANLINFESVLNINNSYNVGDIYADYEYVGGFIGTIDFLSDRFPSYLIGSSNNGEEYLTSLNLSITNSYSSANIIYDDSSGIGAGGLIGYLFNFNDEFIPSISFEVRNVFIDSLTETLDDPIIGSFGGGQPVLQQYLGFIKLVFKDVFFMGDAYNDIYGASFLIDDNKYFKNNDFIFNQVWDTSNTWVFNSNINNGLPTLKNNQHFDSAPIIP